MLNQPGQQGWLSPEVSPYGVALNVRYPVCDAEALVQAGQQAMVGWQALGAAGRTGVCLEAVSYTHLDVYKRQL